MEGKDEVKDLIAGLPYSYETTSKASEVKVNYAKMEGKRVSVAGRALAVRKAGKLVFIDIQDSTGKIQAYFDYKALGEERFNRVKGFNAGDIIGVEGKVFKTTPGEISISVESYSFLAKAIKALPSKWHGLQDTELRYRKRYLDLIMNDRSKNVFIARSRIVSLMRQFLNSNGFMEVETPTIQPLYGGATAMPFKTHVNTLNEEHYIRISDELYLKRLIIGGLEKVYEICKDFRNEDFDTEHSPEFTMLEWYQAYGDYSDGMKLCEGMLSYIVKEIFGAHEITYQGKKISFKTPFKKIKFVESLNEKIGKDIFKMSDKELFDLVEKHGIKLEKGKRNRATAYDKLLKIFVHPHIVDPTFVIDYPAGTTALCRPKRGDPRLIERFELFIGGLKFANAYSELQNPIIQRENFEAEAEKRKAGDAEAEPMDMDFIEAMEYGMPPTEGFGIGIDKITMLLTDSPSIKDVILFPMEKRGKR